MKYNRKAIGEYDVKATSLLLSYWTNPWHLHGTKRGTGLLELPRSFTIAQVGDPGAVRRD